LERLNEQGTEYLPELIRILVNAAMKIERQKHLGAGCDTIAWRSEFGRMEMQPGGVCAIHIVGGFILCPGLVRQLLEFDLEVNRHP